MILKGVPVRATINGDNRTPHLEANDPPMETMCDECLATTGPSPGRCYTDWPGMHARPSVSLVGWRRGKEEKRPKRVSHLPTVEFMLAIS